MSDEIYDDDESGALSDEARAKIKPQFLTQRQGKDFVLYAGLLDAAHQEGLSAIDSNILQFPNADNQYTAVVKATVTTKRGTFSGIGDANPDNVGRMIALHIIRMAETRAKGRAMRDAINVGVAAVEELGHMERSNAPQRREPPQQQPARQAPRPATPAPARQPAQAVEQGDTEAAPLKWVELVRALAGELFAEGGKAPAIPNNVTVGKLKEIKKQVDEELAAIRAKRGFAKIPSHVGTP